MTIAEAYRRAQVCVNSFWAKSDEVVDGMVPLMEESQRAQMMAGETSLGEPITPPYTLFTIRMKEMKGQPSDRVTLRDTGAFHSAIFVERNGKELIFGSTDEKTTKIIQKYGEGIFGLKTEAYEPLREEWANRISQWARQTIQNT